MKKLILILLCFIMLIYTVSCHQNSDGETAQSSPKQDVSGEAVDLSNSPKISKAPTYGITDYSVGESIKSLSAEYRLFQETVNDNVYDKWLEKEKSEASRSDKDIYADYWKFWKSELLFTVEKAKPLFNDVDEYDNWKSNLEQWLVTTQEILKAEMSICNVTMCQLEVIIPYCKLIRQKTIDTKYFCYSIENYCIDDVDTKNLIGLCWLNDISK